MTKRLYRSIDDRRIGGVCGGLGEYFGIDSNIVRLSFVIAAFFGVGLIAYFLIWIIFPEGTSSDAGVRQPAVRNIDTNVVLGGIVLVAALVVGFSDPFDDTVIVPLALLGVGIWLLTQRPIDGDEAPDQSRPSDATGSAPASSSESSSGATGSSASGEPDRPSTAALRSELAGPTVATLPPDGDASDDHLPDLADDDVGLDPEPSGDPGDDATAELPPPPPWATGAAPQPQPPEPPAPRPPAYVTRVVLSLCALVVAGAIAVAQTGWWDITATQVIGAILGVIGVGLVVGAIWGGSRGLIPLGIVAAISLIPAAGIDSVIEHGVGDREYVVESVEDLREEYKLGIGNLEVDLRDLELDGATRRVKVDLGIGEARVLIPADTTIIGTADVGVGRATVLGQDDEGLGNDVGPVRVVGTEGQLIIDVEVGIGEGRIERRGF